MPAMSENVRQFRLAALRLFNAYPVVEKNTIYPYDGKLLERMISNGYIIEPYTDHVEDFLPYNMEILDLVESVVGLSGEKANASFHKSWSVIAESSMEQLVYQQIIHYMTVYGFESLGIYDKNTIYFPSEKVEIPEMEGLRLTVVRCFTKNDMYEATLKLVGSGIALSKDTINDLMTIIEGSNFDTGIYYQTKNRELRAKLAEHFKIVPSKPEDFLRYVINKLTGDSLVIKNSYMVDRIKMADGGKLDKLMIRAPKNMASIFLRYKPIFLAMKSISKNKTYYNKLRRQAKYMHVPAKVEYLNTVTEQLKKGNLSISELKTNLAKASVFRKIRLAYALNNRVNPCESALYRVRNGRGWATENKVSVGTNHDDIEALDTVLASISGDLREKVSGKTIYSPPQVFYALPSSEKQFLGNVPANTYIEVETDMIIGVYWNNIPNHRVDLDLSGMSMNGKIGWDGAYRHGSQAMFSGDVTDPPAGGASELFYFSGKGPHDSMVFSLYNYTIDRTRGKTIPFKFFIASERIKDLKRNYMVDPNNIIFDANMSLTDNTILGLFANIGGKNRFYFSSVGVGNGITSRNTDSIKHTRNFMNHQLENPIPFDVILKRAGANLVYERPTEGEFIDLSVDALNKTTFLDMLV